MSITPNANGTCPIPPIPQFPGILNPPPSMPQPPMFTPLDVPLTKDPSRPPKGSPEEKPWVEATIGDIMTNGPKIGPRKDEFLPFLWIRASSTDDGNRPLNDVFWESPDIFVTPNIDAASAPLIPSTTENVAVANMPNTLYAHVWNLGFSPAYSVRVEFYWCNPSLGISRATANFIGATYLDLGNRLAHNSDWETVQGPKGSYITRGAHAIVKCPNTWIPTYENSGHECLVVRVFEVFKDALSPNEFNAAADRHVAQRNISVAVAHSPAVLDTMLDLGYPKAVGTVTVDLEILPPSASDFLTLAVGPGGTPLVPSTAPITAGLLQPSYNGEQVEQVYKTSQTFSPGCERGFMRFHAESDVKKGEAHLIRVRQHSNGQVIGGCTMILMRPYSQPDYEWTRTGVYGVNSVSIADRVRILDGNGGYAPVVCLGSGGINVGVTALVGNIISKGPVQIRNYGEVHGDAKTPGGKIDLQDGAKVIGNVSDIGDTTIPVISLTFGSAGSDPVNVGPDGQQTLAPGNYGRVQVFSRSKLFLTAGKYCFESFSIEPQASIICDCSSGAVQIYVHSDCYVRGDFSEKNNASLQVLLACFGQNGLSIERPFTGVVVVPNGTLNLATINGVSGTPVYKGAFFGKNVTIQPDVVVQFAKIKGIPSIL